MNEGGGGGIGNNQRKREVMLFKKGQNIKTCRYTSRIGLYILRFAHIEQDLYSHTSRLKHIHQD